MTVSGGVLRDQGRVVLRDLFAVQQRRVDGSIGRRGYLFKYCHSQITRVVLGERMKTVGSNVVWGHGRGHGGRGGPGHDLYMADFLWMPPSLEAGQLFMPALLYR